MNKKPTRKAVTTRARSLDAERRRMLQHRKREIQIALQGRIQSARAGGPRPTFNESQDAGVDVQADILFTLIETQAALVRRIDQALAQIDAGEYGFCIDCRDDIAANRLRALPFAVRCTACEEAIERRAERSRRLADRIDPFSETSTGQ